MAWLGGGAAVAGRRPLVAAGSPRLAASLLFSWFWGLLAQDCFSDGEEMAYCCSRGDACFTEKRGRHSGRSYAECCGRGAVKAILDQARAVMLKAAAAHEFAGVVETLKAVLLSMDAEDLEAWEILAHALGRQALARYDALADHGVERVFSEAAGGGGGGPDAFAVARELNYAAHFCERFFQVLWYSHAQRSGQAPLEVELEEVRPLFAETLRTYGVLQQALDMLTYHPLGRNARDAQLAPLSARGVRTPPSETVVLVVAVVGAWADVAVVTLWSILRSRTAALRIFVFGDEAGVQDMRRVIDEAEGRWASALEYVSFEYIDLFAHPRMQAYLQRLPEGCARTRMSAALFARLVCHELLPADVRRAIALDLGDVLVFDDIVGLWREGDRLGPDELLAAASHRSAEEAARRGKPSRLNGGVVLYEVERMRRSNYTEDTIRAAYHGLERRYPRFCVWDQDIINAMHEDLWGNTRVRVLPCRWSLFPVTGWQFSWNTPNHWLPELFQQRRYPGLLAANHVEHFCPDEMQLLPNVFAFQSDWHKSIARDVALIQGLHNRKPGAGLKAPDGTFCACGERAALLHVPSTMKLWPWAHRLFEHHRPPSSRQAEPGAFFTAREEQKASQTGGGFWGAEDSGDIAATGQAALIWAKEAGLTLVEGRCATLPASASEYTRVEFKARRPNEDLVLLVETNAETDAHLFLGQITQPPPGIQHSAASLLDVGLEIGLGIFGDTRSVIRWGVQGVQLAAHEGGVLAGAGGERTRQSASRWSKFWLKVAVGGAITVGLGSLPGDSTIMAVNTHTPREWDWSSVDIYVGALGSKPVQWFLCHD